MVSSNVVAVAPDTFDHPDVPLSLTCHWNVVVKVGRLVTLPAEAVIVSGTLTKPDIVGKVVITGIVEVGGIASIAPVLPTTILYGVLLGECSITPVSYTHLTLPTIYSV